ncbi:hypothetical protein SAMN02910358_00420 [Lachnospiraceae bacterium XBB1006]|nr:hypothetical protein SAMN02910358_00420 [Lachnospiraceae bacterium XBB1006]
MNNKYKFDANSFGMRLCKIREFNGLTQENLRKRQMQGSAPLRL